MLWFAVSGCGGGNHPLSPEGEKEKSDGAQREAQWNDFIDHAIQSPGEGEIGHIDISNVVIGKIEHWEPGIYGHILKRNIGDIKGYTAVVVAWAERPGPTSNWDVYFRVLYWDYSGTFSMGPRFLVANPGGANQTYPAVTSYWYELDQEPAPFKEMIVDISFDKEISPNVKEVWHRRYRYIIPFQFPLFDNFYEFPVASGPVPPPMNHPPGESYKHSDIIFYAFPGYPENNQNACETVFLVYEYQYEKEYCIVLEEFDGFQWHNPNIIRRTKRLLGNQELRVWPQYPRVDAGLDFSANNGTSRVTSVWHELKWTGTSNPFANPVYFDYDWAYHPVDLSFYPIYDTSLSTHIFQNDPQLWHIFPYIDFDPIEKFFDTGLETYAHVVVTVGHREGISFVTDWAKVFYGSSKIIQNGTNLVLIDGYEGSHSGMATLAMYAGQGVNDEVPDFDVLYVTDYYGPGYQTYSRKVGFVDAQCTSLDLTLTPEVVSDSGNEPDWVLPLQGGYAYIPPVGAIFDYKNQEGVWAASELTTPIGYGDYEVYY